MTWESVKTQIVFWDVVNGVTWPTVSGHAVSHVSTGARLLILSYLEEVYTVSSIARDFLDLISLNDIRIGTAANGDVAFGVYSSTPYIGIDSSKIPLTYFMNDHGYLTKANPVLALMHEMQHMMWGFGARDPEGSDVVANGAGYDHDGRPITFQNAVARDMGWLTEIQSSYASGMAGYAIPGFTDLRPFILKAGHSYTRGEQVAITRFGDAIGETGADNILDQRAKGNSDDLIIGFSGDDILHGGGGRDFIYGGDDDDVITGGAGNDEIWGGLEEDQGRSDGIDTTDYSQAAAGIAITLGAEGDIPSLSVADGDGGTDTLHSIEVIKGSAHDDVLTISSLTATVAAAFDKIDLRGGNDTVDVGAVATAVEVTKSGGTVMVRLLSGGDALEVNSVQRVVGTSLADKFETDEGDFDLDGGGGEDEVKLASAAGTRLDGDGGSARIGGSGNLAFANIEKFVGGAGGDMMYAGSLIAHYVGGDGDGVNYLEGGGEGTKLESGAGDSYIVARDGAKAISGAGNDLIEAEGESPVTIVFTRGSGHDVLGSHFGAQFTTADDDQAVTWGTLSPTHTSEGGTNYLRVLHDWVGARGGDTILFEGLGPDDLELVWDWHTTYIHGDWQLNPEARIGPAAIRIKATGDTLYLGILMGWSGTGAGVFGPEEMLPFSLFIVSPGSFDGFDGGWDTPLDDHSVSNPNIHTVEIDLFEFGDGQRYSLMDLFSPGSVTSTPLPPEWSEAQDLLSRLASENGVIAGTEGDDSLPGTEGDDDIISGEGWDDIDPGGGDDFVRGGGGDDNIMGGAGDDNYHGGDGVDSVDYYASTAAVSVDLAAGTAAGADIGSDRLASIEKAYGGSGDDSLAGDSGANSLYGDDGADLLAGRDGDDWLNGAGGADVLAGGAGADLFFFQTGGTGLGAAADLIADFVSGEDRIDLSRIDADTVTEGHQAFVFISGAAFSLGAGELRQFADGVDTRLQADTDGDGNADFEIVVAGPAPPLETDYIWA